MRRILTDNIVFYQVYLVDFGLAYKYFCDTVRPNKFLNLWIRFCAYLLILSNPCFPKKKGTTFF
jgi:hypothetical protein